MSPQLGQLRPSRDTWAGMPATAPAAPPGRLRPGRQRELLKYRRPAGTGFMPAAAGAK